MVVVDGSNVIKGGGGCGNNDGLYTIFISNVCICNSNINSSDFLL